MPGGGSGGEGAPRVEFKKASFGSVAKTVLLAFFGVRKRAQHEQETVHLSPGQIIVAGLIGGVVIVTTLVLLVKFIVGRATG